MSVPSGIISDPTLARCAAYPVSGRAGARNRSLPGAAPRPTIKGSQACVGSRAAAGSDRRLSTAPVTYSRPTRSPSDPGPSRWSLRWPANRPNACPRGLANSSRWRMRRAVRAIRPSSPRRIGTPSARRAAAAPRHSALVHAAPLPAGSSQRRGSRCAARAHESPRPGRALTARAQTRPARVSGRLARRTCPDAHRSTSRRPRGNRQRRH